MQRRLTNQRKIICDVVKYLDHPTAEGILNEVKIKHPNLGRATVFRNLNVLVELGELQKLYFPLNPTRYDARVSNHNHAICEKCGQVWDLLEETKLDYPALADIEINNHSIIYYGTCQKCLFKEEKNVKS